MSGTVDRTVGLREGFFFPLCCVLFLRLETLTRACPQDLGIILLIFLKTVKHRNYPHFIDVKTETER